MILELQRKAEEQRRKLETVKRKSQVFDQFLSGNVTNGTTSNNGVNPGDQPDFKRIHL